MVLSQLPEHGKGRENTWKSKSGKRFTTGSGVDACRKGDVGRSSLYYSYNKADGLGLQPGRGEKKGGDVTVEGATTPGEEGYPPLGRHHSNAQRKVYQETPSEERSRSSLKGSNEEKESTRRRGPFF